MSDYDNRNKGVLFRNDDKREGRQDPDYRGSITMPNNDEHWLNAWLNEAKSGRKYLSLKIGEIKQARPDQGAAPAEKAPDFDDDIPFIWAGIGVGSGYLADAMGLFDVAQTVL